MLALLSAILFGLSTPLSKILLDSIPAVQLAGFLYLGTALILTPTFLRDFNSMKLLMEAPSSQLSILYVTGAVFFGGILGPILLLIGLSMTFAGTAALLLNFETVATAIIAYLFFKEHLSKITWIANIGVFLSGIILSFEGEIQGFIGAIFIMCAGICWGLDNNFTAKIDCISPIQCTFIKGLGAGIVNISLGYLLLPQLPQMTFILLALIIGAFSYGISIVLYITSAQQIGATRSQMVFASGPFWGLGFSILLLNEGISINQIIAVLILIISLSLLFRDYHEHEHFHPYQSHKHSFNNSDPHHSQIQPDNQNAETKNEWHVHQPTSHSHTHLPDLHHRHDHEKDS
ncbi:MAG: DMT family transporter [Candidatus Hodarchaeales archaeon]|jgi:drug/metabolite transporter (DMT)-like permease